MMMDDCGGEREEERKMVLGFRSFDSIMRMRITTRYFGFLYTLAGRI